MAKRNPSTSSLPQIAPLPARNLSVDTATSPGSVIVTWKKPADIGGGRDARCAYVSEGGDQAGKHAAAAITYRYVFYNARTGAHVVDAVEFSSTDADLRRTIDNLPIQNWHTLGVRVSAYSSVCERWSEPVDVEFEWLGPLACEWRRNLSGGIAFRLECRSTEVRVAD